MADPARNGVSQWNVKWAKPQSKSSWLQDERLIPFADILEGETPGSIEFVKILQIF